MNFTSPDTAYTTHPTDALFSAHFKSAVLMAIYLMGGAALTAGTLIGLVYSEQLSDAWALLPYALMAAMVLWFGLGAWAIKKHQQQVQRCDHRYHAHIQRHTANRQPTVADLASDEPWELRAFWGHYWADAAAPTQPTQTSYAPVQRTPAMSPAMPQAVRTGNGVQYATDTSLEVELIASMTEHKPLRPISLFGSVQ